MKGGIIRGHKYAKKLTVCYYIESGICCIEYLTKLFLLICAILEDTFCILIIDLFVDSYFDFNLVIKNTPAPQKSSKLPSSSLYYNCYYPWCPQHYVCNICCYKQWNKCSLTLHIGAQHMVQSCEKAMLTKLYIFENKCEHTRNNAKSLFLPECHQHVKMRKKDSSLYL